MQQSRLILGLSSERPDSALGQVLLWNGMTVGTGLRRELLRHLPRVCRHLRGSSRPLLQGHLQEALEELQRHLREAPEKEATWTREFTSPLDPQAMKLCRLLDYFDDMPIDRPPNPGTLHVAGLEIERRTIAAFRNTQREWEPGTPPVNSIDHLAGSVLRRLFRELDAKAPSRDRERIAQEIADALRRMDDDLQDEVRRVAGLNDLSVRTLRRAGSLAALGAGLTSVVGVAGFTAYTTLSATIATVGGLVGLALPFSVYVTAASLLAFVTNPLVVAAVAAGGSTWLVKATDRRMRAELLPLLVTFAAAEAKSTTHSRRQVRDLADHLAGRYEEFLAGDSERRAQLRQAFPAFRDSEESHRAR